jgi:hypothetical protein
MNQLLFVLLIRNEIQATVFDSDGEALQRQRGAAPLVAGCFVALLVFVLVFVSDSFSFNVLFCYIFVLIVVVRCTTRDYYCFDFIR